MAPAETHDQLELIAPGGQVTFFDLDPARGVANIGRHPDNDIVLDSPSITPFHAILDYHTRPYQLIFLDSAAHAPRAVNADDIIQLDGYSIVVVTGGGAVPVQAAPAAAPPLAEAAPLPPAPPEQPAPATSAEIGAAAGVAASLAAGAVAGAAAEIAAEAGEPQMDLDMMDAILMATEAQQDEVIVVQVQTLTGGMDKKGTTDLDLSVAAGESATLEATITNGGDVVASFDVVLPGLPAEWVTASPESVNLPEGGRTSVLITISPPRKASVRARGYFFSVLVRSPDHPDRRSSTPGMLVVQPFYQFSLGSLDPRQQVLSYRKKTAIAVLPLVNQGNGEAGFRVEGEDERRACRFEFEVPDEKVAQATRAEVRVPPEHTLPLRMHIIPNKRPVVGLGRVNHPFTVTVTSLNSRQTPRSVLGEVQAAPLIGPIPIILVALALVALFVLIYRPVIHSFTASSPAISAGESVSLVWKASQFSTMRLEPGGLNLPGPQGTLVLLPIKDTLYTLTADNLLSQLLPKVFRAQRQVKVAVSAVLPAFRQFSADRTVVTIGDTASLSWDVARADSLTLIINGAAETLLPNEFIGNRKLRVDKKTTVQLVAVNAYTPPEGVSRNLVIEVVPVPPVIPPPPVIKRFDITPLEVVAGQVVQLSWEVTGVEKVTITGVGEMPATGSVSVVPPNDAIYTLTASNGMPGGTVNREQKVSVRPAPTPTPIPGIPKIQFFKASPQNAILGSAEANAVKLSWQVTGDVTNIEVTSSGSSNKSSGLPKNGALTVSVSKQTLYVLTAYNGSLNASQTVQVTVSNPVPVATSLEPSTTEASGGSSGLVVVVNGANFNGDSRVRVNGSDRSTTFINAGRLSAILLPDDVKSAGTLNIVVFTPLPGGGTSSLLTLSIINPRPAISNVNPPFLFKGGAGTTLIVTGLGFVNPDSKVYFGSTQRPTTFVDSSTLSVGITGPDLAEPSTFSITVRNPGPSGVAFISNAVNFEIRAEYPVPVLTAITPTVATVGGEGFTLYLTGANNTFIRDNTLVNWQGVYLPNVVYSDTNHLQVFVPAAFLPTQIGTVNVSTVNVVPSGGLGGGQSNILTFTMTSPGINLVPSVTTATIITDAAKAIAVQLSAAQRETVTVSLVSNWPAALTIPSSVSIPAGGTSATFTATTGMLASSQGVTVTATLPGSLGNLTGQALIYINNPRPVVSSLSPAWRLAASGGFNLTVTGSNFIPGSQVRWNGSARTTTYLGPTQLSASISALDVATGGPVTVAVYNPTPAGGLSNLTSFDIRYRLEVRNLRPTRGNITSTPGGIVCGSTCSLDVSSTTGGSYTLTALPTGTNAFNGWGGDCAGAGLALTCTVTMDGNHYVTGDFAAGHSLTVVLAGINPASPPSVSSSPPGIDTSIGNSSAAFVQGSTVYLIAQPSLKSGFENWGGACAAAGVNTNCTVTMTADLTAIANFSARYEITGTFTGVGAGSLAFSTTDTGAVAFSPNPCPSSRGTCRGSSKGGATVTLTATAAITSTFLGWGGDCASAGLNPVCSITMAGDSSVTANFTPIYPVTLAKSSPAGAAGGTVTGVSNPAQIDINCGAACASEVLSYTLGTQVTLTASPTAGTYAFVGWTGACSGTSPTCAITVNGARSVTADFRQLYNLTAAVTGTGTGTITSTDNIPAALGYAALNCSSTSCAPATIAYPGGYNYSIWATPDAANYFNGWTSGPCSGTRTNPCVVNNLSQPYTFTAEFVPLTLRVVVGANGSISSADTFIAGCTNTGGACTHDYPATTVVNLTATPDPTYGVSSWIVNGVAACGTLDTCAVTMNAPTTVTVSFIRVTFPLNVTSNPSGLVESTAPDNQISCPGLCSGDYITGTAVTLQVTPTVGYTITSWTVTGTGAPTCGATSTCTMTMTTTRTVTVNYSVITFPLIVHRTGGVVGGVTRSVVCSNPVINCTSQNTSGNTAGCYANNVNYGTVVTLTAVSSDPNQSMFSTWTGGSCAGSTANPCVFTMVQAEDITALFVLGRLLTVAPTAGGSVASSDGLITGCTSSGGTCTHYYPDTTPVTLTATSNSGYLFTGWSGDCTGTGDCNVTMSAARTVNATFTAITHTLTISKNGTGGGTLTSTVAPTFNCGLGCTTPQSQSYPENTVITLTATPPVSSTLAGWTGCDTNPTATTCQVTLSAGRSVVATFDLYSYTVQVNKAGNGTGTITDGGGFTCGVACAGPGTPSYSYASNVNLATSPGIGSIFSGWAAGCDSNSPPSTCQLNNITAGRSVTASFTLITYTLNVTVTNPISGTLTVTPPGPPACSGSCTYTYNHGDTASFSTTFIGGPWTVTWGGDCSGFSGTTGSIPMTDLITNKNCTVTFFGP